MIVFLFGFSASYAVTPIVSTKSHPSGTKNEVMKSSHFVKKIENNMIYLENNKKYSLNGVTVTNLTATNRISQKKTMAELMFVKGELKEVILR
jgi:hypothetical protein